MKNITRIEVLSERERILPVAVCTSTFRNLKGRNATVEELNMKHLTSMELQEQSSEQSAG